MYFCYFTEPSQRVWLSGVGPDESLQNHDSSGISTVVIVMLVGLCLIIISGTAIGISFLQHRWGLNSLIILKYQCDKHDYYFLRPYSKLLIVLIIH